MRSSYQDFSVAHADFLGKNKGQQYKSQTEWDTCNDLLPISRKIGMKNNENSNNNTIINDGTPITLQEIYYITKCTDSIRSSLLNLFVTSTFIDLKNTF